MTKITMGASDLERVAEHIRATEALFYKDGEDATPHLVIPKLGITDSEWWPGFVVNVLFEDGFLAVELDAEEP
jgi:hypothetical protein